MGGYSAASFEDEDTRLATAWPRFWARIFDISIYSVPAALLIGIVFPSFFTSSAFQGPTGNLVSGMVMLPFSMIIDATIIAFFGSSPGKAIAGLYVAGLDQERLSFETSFQRNALVYLKGMILGLPLFALIGYINGQSAIRDHGITSWDEHTKTRVYASSNNAGRTVLIGILAVIALGLNNALSKMA